MSEHNPLDELNSILPGEAITLPSLGFFYTKEDFNEEVNFEEFRVRPFSLWSEMRFKSFDAIMSGQATKEFLATVAPQIKNWKRITSVDVEMIMAASRKASYGNDMKIEVTCTNPEVDAEGKPVCTEKTAFLVNLQSLIASYPILNKEHLKDWRVDLKAADDKTIQVLLRLPDYNSTLEALKIYVEQRRAHALVNSDVFSALNEEQKHQLDEDAGANYVKSNVITAVAATDKIILPSGTEITDSAIIKEMYSSHSFPNSWLQSINKKIDMLIEPYKNCGTQDVECPKCNHVTKNMPVLNDSQYFFIDA